MFYRAALVTSIFSPLRYKKIDLSNPRVTKASYLILPGLIGVGVIDATLLVPGLYQDTLYPITPYSSYPWLADRSALHHPPLTWNHPYPYPPGT